MPRLPRGRNLKSTMGRKPILSPQMAERIVASLQMGATIEDAIQVAGIAPSTYHLWIKKGDQFAKRPRENLNTDERAYVDFSENCKNARATGKVGLLNELNYICFNRNHPKHFYAVIWKLARQWPREFGHRSIPIDFDEPLTLDTPGGSVPSATCNIIVEGGPVPDSGPIIDEPEETP